MTVEPTAPPAHDSPDAPKDWSRLRQDEQASVDLKANVALLAIYLIDAAFLALFWVCGVGHWASALAFVVTGLLVAGGGMLVLRDAWQRQRAVSIDDWWFVAVRAAAALVVTLGVALADPGFLGLMLMTVIVIIPTAALRLPPRGVLVLCVAAAMASVAVLALDGGQVTVPMDSPAQQVLSGLFLVWTLAKGASTTVAGMALRLKLDKSHAELAAALARVQELAERDELTGLPNRRRVLAALAEERARCSRHGHGFAVAMLDIDHFKRVNDRHGHSKGDDVLKAVARLMGEDLRAPDVVGRMGGEEFLVILPDTPGLNPACVTMERVRARIAGHDWARLAPDLQVTVSIGVALARADEPVERLLDAADQGLYAAKGAGRNRVVAAGSGPSGDCGV